MNIQVLKRTGLVLVSLLGAVGGVTSIRAFRPAIDRASDYAAEAVNLYCEIPPDDRRTFGDLVRQKTRAGNMVRVYCYGDP